MLVCTSTAHRVKVLQCRRSSNISGDNDIMNLLGNSLGHHLFLALNKSLR